MSIQGEELSERTQRMLMESAIREAVSESRRKTEEAKKEYVRQRPEMFPEHAKVAEEKRDRESKFCPGSFEDVFDGMEKFIEEHPEYLKETDDIFWATREYKSDLFSNLGDVADYVSKFYEEDGIVFNEQQIKSALLHTLSDDTFEERYSHVAVRVKGLYVRPEKLNEELGVHVSMMERIR